MSTCCVDLSPPAKRTISKPPRTVARADIHPHFRHALANGLNIAKIARFGMVDAPVNGGFCALVAQVGKPLGKRFGLLDLVVHGLIAFTWIQKSSIDNRSNRGYAFSVASMRHGFGRPVSSGTEALCQTRYTAFFTPFVYGGCIGKPQGMQDLNPVDQPGTLTARRLVAPVGGLKPIVQETSNV